jgi:TM2 domain-containing membrane protein YozV
MNNKKEKLVAALLAIFLGGLGIHKFYLASGPQGVRSPYVLAGVIQIVLSVVCGIGALIALIEGILYLTKSDEEFQSVYGDGVKAWF